MSSMWPALHGVLGTVYAGRPAYQLARSYINITARVLCLSCFVVALLLRLHGDDSKLRPIADFSLDVFCQIISKMQQSHGLFVIAKLLVFSSFA